MNGFMRGEKFVPLLYNILYEWEYGPTRTKRSWSGCLIEIDLKISI
jgi:hypothetical protein